jgi:uncharacterized membrane protein
MGLMRILKHLWYGNMHVSNRFPKAALDRIQAAVAAAEARTSGEVRFAVEASLDPKPLFAGQAARERALEVFGSLGVWDTEANNGVLIYLLLADRDVEIVADRGIHAKVGAAGWEEVCKAMEAEFRAGRFEEGTLKGIAAVGRLLEAHFPKAGQDPNELPDRPALI